MYLIHMFEFTCLRSSHQKLFFVELILFNIEIDVLQNSVNELNFSKTAVRQQLYWRWTPFQVFHKKNYLDEYL